MARHRLTSSHVLLLACGGLYVAAAAQARAPRRSALAVAAATISAPVLAAADSLGTAWDDLGLGRRDIERTLAELTQLREQAGELRRTNQLLASEVATLRQGSRLLAGVAPLAEGAVLARVVAREVLTTHTLLLDRGARDGVEADAAVLAEEGVLGRVETVFAGSCRVQLLSHPAAAAAARIVGVPTETLLLGGEQATLTGLSPYTEVAPDLPVVTTGSEGIYPPGLLLGTTGQGRTTGLFTVVEIHLAVQPAAVLVALILPPPARGIR
ncbi:MAG: rod shape-determining protein MreC [Acidobacteriota bacterium]